MKSGALLAGVELTLQEWLLLSSGFGGRSYVSWSFVIVFPADELGVFKKARLQSHLLLTE